MTPLERARLWAKNTPGTGKSGTGRSDACFAVAAGLLQGFMLNEYDTMDIMQDWNRKCEPRWTDKELEHKICDVQKHTPAKGYGWKLNAREYADKSNYTKNVDEVNTPKKYPATWSPKTNKDEEKLHKLALHGAEVFSKLEDSSIEELIRMSPLPLPESPMENFRAYLALWKNHPNPIWLGNTKDTSRPTDIVFFRTADEWYKKGIPHPLALWTSGCSFKEGSYSRCKDNLATHKYRIIESDKISYEKQAAIIKWLITEIKLPIEMVVNTMGSSLHAWWNTTGYSESFINNLQAMLVGIHNGQDKRLVNGEIKVDRKFKGGMQCDPATFRGSQPARLPGAFRPSDPEKGKKGGLQHILYYNPSQS